MSSVGLGLVATLGASGVWIMIASSWLAHLHRSRPTRFTSAPRPPAAWVASTPITCEKNVATLVLSGPTLKPFRATSYPVLLRSGCPSLAASLPPLLLGQPLDPWQLQVPCLALRPRPPKRTMTLAGFTGCVPLRCTCKCCYCKRNVATKGTTLTNKSTRGSLCTRLTGSHAHMYRRVASSQFQ
eukprot:3131987-Amphidinium_carterae.1